MLAQLHDVSRHDKWSGGARERELKSDPEGGQWSLHEDVNGPAEPAQIVAVSHSDIPTPVLAKYSREATGLKAFLLKERPGVETFKYALLEVPPTAHGSFTRIVFVMRGSGPYAGREIGTCLAASGRPIASCSPASP